jgi:hypothetical protein
VRQHVGRQRFRDYGHCVTTDIETCAMRRPVDLNAT